MVLALKLEQRAAVAVEGEEQDLNRRRPTHPRCCFQRLMWREVEVEVEPSVRKAALPRPTLPFSMLSRLPSSRPCPYPCPYYYYCLPHCHRYLRPIRRVPVGSRGLAHPSSCAHEHPS